MFLVILGVAASLQAAVAADARPPLRITFVSPQDADTSFWGLAHDFARASARDLGIDLRIIYNESRHRFTYIDAFKKALYDPQKPDYVVGIFLHGIAQPVLNLADRKNIPVFMINSDVAEAEQSAIGRSRQTHPLFIGHMLPDEKRAGYRLAKWLIRAARQEKPGKQIEMLGVSGHRESSVARDRVTGLVRAADEEGVQLHQVIYTDWTREATNRVASGLLKRYPGTDLMWFASDDMALEGLKVLDQLDRKAVIGGFDWQRPALDEIRKQRFQASLGGHFVELGFALVLLHDHFNGIDFDADPGLRIQTEMALITPENIVFYDEFVKTRNWDRVDFRTYSKHLNPELTRYDFSFDSLIRNLP